MYSFSQLHVGTSLQEVLFCEEFGSNDQVTGEELISGDSMTVQFLNNGFSTYNSRTLIKVQLGKHV